MHGDVDEIALCRWAAERHRGIWSTSPSCGSTRACWHRVADCQVVYRCVVQVDDVQLQVTQHKRNHTQNMTEHSTFSSVALRHHHHHHHQLQQQLLLLLLQQQQSAMHLYMLASCQLCHVVYLEFYAVCCVMGLRNLYSAAQINTNSYITIAGLTKTA